MSGFLTFHGNILIQSSKLEYYHDNLINLCFKGSTNPSHKSTGNFDKDVVFIPSTRAEVQKRWGIDGGKPTSNRLDQVSETLIEESPLISFLVLILVLIVGFPLYLLTNFGGQDSIDKYRDRWVSHYFPTSPIFEKHQYSGVILSNIGNSNISNTKGLISWFSFQVYLGFKTTLLTPIFYFFIPWIQVNMWLVLITYLQHTDPRIPHYSTSKWDFLKGALTTVDRDWGFLNLFFHHITDTHVVHHLFSTMPFYNAVEATRYVKEVVGDWYVSDEGFVESVWKGWRECRFVDPEDEVMFYKN